MRALPAILILLATVAAAPRLARGDSPPPHALSFGVYGFSPGQINWARGVAGDPAGHYVYVANSGLDRIEKFTTAGVWVLGWGSYGSGPGQFKQLIGIAADNDGNVYAADWLNGRIQKFTAAGALLGQWGSNGSGPGQFGHPEGIAIHRATGIVYVADYDNHRIQRFTTAGAYLGQWGSGGTGNGQFSGPSGVAVDAWGAVYVADSGNNRIQKFGPTGAFMLTHEGMFLTRWGSLGSGAGQFNGPEGIMAGADGHLYVTDHWNHRIQKFGPLTTAVPGMTPEAGAVAAVVLGTIAVARLTRRREGRSR